MRHKFLVFINVFLIIVSVVLFILSFSSKISKDQQSLYQNLFAEFIGAFITVNVIDRLLEAKWSSVKSKLAFNIHEYLIRITNDYLAFFNYDDNATKPQLERIRADDKKYPYIQTIYTEILKYDFENKMVQLSMVQMIDLNGKISDQIAELDKLYYESASKTDAEEIDSLLAMKYSFHEANQHLQKLLNTYMVSTTNQSKDHSLEISIYLGLIGLKLNDLFGFMIALERIIEPKRRKIEKEHIDRALDQLSESIKKNK